MYGKVRGRPKVRVRGRNRSRVSEVVGGQGV